MLRIETGSTYTASRVRSGTSARGDWELIVVKPDGRARQEITIFPTNIPSGVIEGCLFTVENIIAVEVKAQKNKDGTWGKDVTKLEAIVSPCDLGGSYDELYDFGSDLEL